MHCVCLSVCLSVLWASQYCFVFQGTVALFDMIEHYESCNRLNISNNRTIGIRGWQACARLMKKVNQWYIQSNLCLIASPPINDIPVPWNNLLTDCTGHYINAVLYFILIFLLFVQQFLLVIYLALKLLKFYWFTLNGWSYIKVCPSKIVACYVHLFQSNHAYII